MGKHARPSLEPSGNEGKKKLKLASNAEDSAPTTKPVADGRQDEGSDQDEEGDEGAQSGEELEEESEEDEDDQEDEDEDEEEHNGNGVKDDRFAAFPEDEAEEPSLSNDDDDEAPIRRVIDPSSLTSLSSKTDRSGILYLPRIPPGMGPGKVKHLLSQWGKVGRIYLAREEEPNVTGRDGTGKKGKKRKHEKHRKHDFKEGWVEMEDKKVARRMAELLNARPIGVSHSTLVGACSLNLRLCRRQTFVSFRPRPLVTHLPPPLQMVAPLRPDRLRTAVSTARPPARTGTEQAGAGVVPGDGREGKGGGQDGGEGGGQAREEEGERRGRGEERQAGEGEEEEGVQAERGDGRRSAETENVQVDGRLVGRPQRVALIALRLPSRSAASSRMITLSLSHCNLLSRPVYNPCRRAYGSRMTPPPCEVGEARNQLSGF